MVAEEVMAVAITEAAEITNFQNKNPELVEGFLFWRISDIYLTDVQNSKKR